MPDNRDVEDLLERWDDLRQQGREISAEELCQAHPDLLTELKRRIHALKAMNWLLESDSSAGGAAKEDADQPARPLPTTLGRYRLTRLIGSGGFGQVWEGFDPELQRTVAIKIPNARRISSVEDAAKFLEEARKVAQLKHPGIVPVHDVGREENYCFIVSDFVDGGSLADRIEEGPMAWHDAGRLVAEIARILQFAHEHGFVHRDVKPANILVDRKGTPFLADFGIAVRETELQEPDTSPGGTLAYMAPEQLRAAVSPTDARTDIFSLGVVLYRLLTGQLPFVANDAAELRQAILFTEPKPPHVLNAEVPGKLERICLKALAKEPDKRYSTAKSLAGDLQAAADAYQGRCLRRAAVGLTIGLIIGAAFWYGWSSRRQRAPMQGQRSADETLADLRTWAESQPPRPVPQDNTGQQVLTEALSTVQQITSPQIPSLTPSTGKDRSETSNLRKSSRPPDSNKSSGGGRTAFALPIGNGVLDLTGQTLVESDYEAIGRNLLLRRLILANTPTTDADLSHLNHVPGLTHLDLSATKITDDGLTALGNLPVLSSLALARTGITDAGLKKLSRLRLKTLDLEGTEITGAGLASLCDRYGVGGYLRELDLRNTALDDSGLSNLKRLTRLKSLRVGGTKITEPGLAELRAAIPSCRIVVDHE